MNHDLIREKSWTLLKQNFLYYIKGGIPYVVFLLAGWLLGVVWFVGTAARSAEAMPENLFSLIALFGLFGLALGLLAGLLMYGYSVFVLRLIRHGETGMGNALAGFSKNGIRFLAVAIPISIVVGGAVGLVENLLTKAGFDWLGILGGFVVSVVAGLVTWLLPYLVHDFPQDGPLTTAIRAWQDMSGKKWSYLRLMIPVILASIGIVIVFMLAGALIFLPIVSSAAGPEGIFIPAILYWFVFIVLMLGINFYFLTLSVVFYEIRVRNRPEEQTYYTVEPPRGY